MTDLINHICFLLPKYVLELRKAEDGGERGANFELEDGVLGDFAVDHYCRDNWRYDKHTYSKHSGKRISQGCRSRIPPNGTHRRRKWSGIGA